ncbi:hypothetical protein WME90_35555 [Sorangium sp. So ce375]|uniref:hypothetical protein n=1 Tax=Sorangium sp. So ce375 TaxID=3133306 RepID=UPI003F5BD73C
MKTLSACLLLGILVGCQKSEEAGLPAASSGPSAGSSAPAAAAPAETASPAAEAAPSAAAPATPAPAEPAPSSTAPASFKDGRSESIASAVGLGCEAKSLDGWLELLCRKKNGTGGHPVRAVIQDPSPEAAAEKPSEPVAADGAGQDPDAGPSNEVRADERGELRLVVPLRAGAKQTVTLEWTDTRYELQIDGTNAKLDWAGSVVSHRRACQTLLDENRARISDAQKLEGPEKISAAEATRLPKFGVCQPAGLGSWALSLTRFAGAGEGAARALAFDIEVVRIDLEGKRSAAPLGTIEVAPGGLAISALNVYDFDDDGNDELIVPYELNALAAGAKPAAPSPIWTFSNGAVSAYSKAPSTSGGLGIEHLDHDMRPDLGSYGPFVAWLGADCGVKSCPSRVTGPKFYFHSAQDGSFSATDAAATAALGRACGQKPAAIVVTTGGGVNVAQTAKNLVCARALGAARDALASELAAKRADLCGGAATCALSSTFEAWLDAALPAELGSAAKR